MFFFCHCYYSANSTLLFSTQILLLYYPLLPQASSAFSALIFKDFYDNNSNNNNLKGLFIQGKKEYHKCFVSIVTNEGIDLKHAS